MPKAAKKHQPSLEQLVRKLRTLKELQKNPIPPKKHTKLPSTKASENGFNKTLRGLPGSSKIAAISVRQMVDAPETGCIVRKGQISAEESARNSYTTKGNYIV